MPLVNNIYVLSPQPIPQPRLVMEDIEYYRECIELIKPKMRPQLPSELLVIIAEQSKPADATSLMLTCKRASICSKVIDLYFEKEIDSIQMDIFVANCNPGRYTVSLHKSHIHIKHFYSWFTKNGIEEYQTYYPYLKTILEVCLHISFRGSGSSDILYLVEEYKNQIDMKHLLYECANWRKMHIAYELIKRYHSVYDVEYVKNMYELYPIRGSGNKDYRIEILSCYGEKPVKLVKNTTGKTCQHVFSRGVNKGKSCGVVFSYSTLEEPRCSKHKKLFKNLRNPRR